MSRPQPSPTSTDTLVPYTTLFRSGGVKQWGEISVFLKQDVAGERATALAEELRDRRNVGDVQLLTPEQGLQSLRDKGVPAPAVDAAGDNPLPYVLVVT